MIRTKKSIRDDAFFLCGWYNIALYYWGKRGCQINKLTDRICKEEVMESELEL